jgi:hypothetical protein
MGAWSLLIMVGLLLVFLGLFTHWSVMLAGALLPFVPVIAEIVRRRRKKGTFPISERNPPK